MTTVVMAAMVISSAILCSAFSDTSNAETTEGPFSLRLTDSEGNDLSDPLFGGKVTIFFDYCVVWSR